MNRGKEDCRRYNVLSTKYHVLSTRYQDPSEVRFGSEYESLNCTKYQVQCTKYSQCAVQRDSGALRIPTSSFFNQRSAFDIKKSSK